MIIGKRHVKGSHSVNKQLIIIICCWGESKDTNILCFYIAFSPSSRNSARRRAAGGGPPSCWVSIWWRKGDGRKQTNKCWSGCSCWHATNAFDCSFLWLSICQLFNCLIVFNISTCRFYFHLFSVLFTAMF